MQHLAPLMPPAGYLHLEAALKSALVNNSLPSQVLAAMSIKKPAGESAIVLADSIATENLQAMPLEQLEALAACAEKYKEVKNPLVPIIFAAATANVIADALSRRRACTGGASTVIAAGVAAIDHLTGEEDEGGSTPGEAGDQEQQNSDEEDESRDSEKDGEGPSSARKKRKRKKSALSGG